MTPPRVRSIAPGVVCLGPWGRTQTNCYLVRSGTSWVLVDAGWAGDEQRILAATQMVLGPREAPAGIVLTHVHPDHSGAALALARLWGCPAWLHPAERPVAVGDFDAMAARPNPLDRWVVLPAMRAIPRRRREALLARGSLADVLQLLQPDEPVPGLPDWVAVATPGHTPGHLSFLRPADAVLISGDALVTLRVNSPAGLLGRHGLSGPPWYTTVDAVGAAASLRRLAGLRPRVLAPGHGWSRTGPPLTAELADLVDGSAGSSPDTDPCAP